MTGSAKTSTATELSGLLVVDKPQGMTSHDVVATTRRILAMRAVGHAGTLDPMATGVLIVLLGSCTKLSQFLTLEDKVYRARVRLGQATDTLDAYGIQTDACELAPALLDELALVEESQTSARVGGRIERALMEERNRKVQVPPAHSAIKQNGMASYVRARRGEQVVLPSRDVCVHRLDCVGASKNPPELLIEAHVSKGYYVRSLARDLGCSLGVPAHLTELRRIRSGSFGLEAAVKLEQGAAVLRDAVQCIEQVARSMFPCCSLTQSGVLRALRGQAVCDQDFECAPGEAVSAWFAPTGNLVAVGDRSRGRPTVLRAFSHVEDLC